MDDVGDAAPANGFGDRWKAHPARTALGAEQTGITYFQLRPGKRSPFSHRHAHAEEIYVILSGTGKIKLGAGPNGLKFLAVGTHHPGDGEPVNDQWTT